MNFAGGILRDFKFNARKKFISKDFQEGLYVHVLLLALAAPFYKEMNCQVELTCQTLKTIAHSIIVHARVLDKYIHFC